MPATYALHAQTVDPTTGAVTDHGAWTGDDVELGDVDEVLNGVGSFSFTAGVLEAYLGTTNVRRNRTEVCLYRNGTAIFAGPIRTMESSDGSRLSVRADSLEGYAADRVLDKAQGRTNYLTNPDFESGLTGWTKAGADSAGLTATADTAQHVLGTQAAKLVRTDANKDSYLYQQFSFTSGAIGDLITVAAWFRYANSGFVGPALGSFGLYVNQQVASVIVNPDPDDLAQLDGTNDRDTWVRIKAITRVPVSTTVTVEVRLYGIGGTIWWDAVQAVLMESIGFDNVDIATIVQTLWQFATDSANGKSALGFTYSCSAVGITQTRNFQHADHIPLPTALQELAEADNGLDWWITPGRVVTTGSPRRGTDRTGTLTLTLDVNCVLARWSVDGHQEATSVTVLGTGSGPDREEANSTTSGVTTMQRIVTPKRNDPPIDTLAPTSVRELALAANPVIWEVTLFDPTVCGVGDKVTFTAPSGLVGSWLATSGAYRVVRKTWHPNSDTATVVLNPA